MAGRKKKIAGSTKAVNDFLVLVYKENPEMTINQLKTLITDPSKYIKNPDAIAVMDAHIKAGFGDTVPSWT